MPATRVYTSHLLFDGASTLADGALAVADGVITAVGPRAEVTAAAGPDAAVTELGQAFLMPGLIDAHTHLHFPIRGFADWPIGLVEPPDYTTLKAAFNAQVYLARGVTSVMDCGTRGNLAVALREAIRAGLCVGPRLVASGMVISPTGGLADTEPDFLHTEHPEGVIADTPSDWRRVIRGQAKHGVDNIKIGVSGSNLNPYSDGGACDMAGEDIALAVAEAHRAGCTIAAHVSPAAGFKDALAAGVDTVHHGFAIDESCVQALAASDAYFVPTAGKLPAMIAGGAARGRDPRLLAEYEAQAERHVAMIAAAVRAGLADRIALGSDAGHLPDHGESALELAVFRQADMTPDQVLASATSVAAAAIGLAETVGALAVGRRADFIVVDGDPLADVGVLAQSERIAEVYLDGRRVARRGVLEAAPDVSAPPSLRPVYAGRASRTSRRMRPGGR